MDEQTQARLDRLFDNLQRHGTVDAPDLEWLLDENNKNRALLRSCLGDYGHIGFTDRHGMVDRIRKRLGR